MTTGSLTTFWGLLSMKALRLSTATERSRSLALFVAQAHDPHGQIDQFDERMVPEAEVL